MIRLTELAGPDRGGTVRRGRGGCEARPVRRPGRGCTSRGRPTARPSRNGAPAWWPSWSLRRRRGREWDALTADTRRVALAADLELKRRGVLDRDETMKSAEPEGLVPGTWTRGPRGHGA